MIDRRHHALYRFYGGQDELLYVGITVSLPARLAKHRDTKEWWHEVSEVTVDHYDSRREALDAEREAIQIEHPRYNIVHNLGPVAPIAAPESRTAVSVLPAGTELFTFRTRTGVVREEPLWLYWEVHGDPITDEYYQDEVSAYDLWRIWLDSYFPDRRCEAEFGPDTVRIWWFVEPAMESAPFQYRSPILDESFLTHYTWPMDPKTEERVQWMRLPVVDKVWGETRAPGSLTTTKGGFFQQASGWKPAPLQPFVNVRQLAAASGLWMPDGGIA